MAIPATAPFTCAGCGHPSDQHGPRCYHSLGWGRYCKCPEAKPPMLPESHEITLATVVTQWACPFCKEQQDVEGEGAVGGWMECAHCHREAWLTDATG